MHFVHLPLSDPLNIPIRPNHTRYAAEYILIYLLLIDVHHHTYSTRTVRLSRIGHLYFGELISQLLTGATKPNLYLICSSSSKLWIKAIKRGDRTTRSRDISSPIKGH